MHGVRRLVGLISLNDLAFSATLAAICQPRHPAVLPELFGLMARSPG